MRAFFRMQSFLSLGLAVLLTIIAIPAFAQTAARVEGLITDNTGAALPGVTVTATNLATNASLTDVSDSKGLYTITPLQVGSYRVQFELSGFKTTAVPAKFEVGQVARIDMKMELGTVSETVTVTAAAPVIERTTSQISTVIEQKQVEDLPLNGRNFTQLATLSPGVTRGVPGSNAAGGGSGTDAETFRYSEFGGAALSVNGLREQFNNYLIEGVDNNEALVNTIAYMPSPDAIQEFSVITTNAPAEYGRAGGAIQNLVLKSGTNNFHGSAFYFDRPKSLAAKPKFATEKPDFKNQDFGATFGGPLVRDRAFFFADYHGLRNSIPIEAGNYVTVPTEKMRNGDFSELLDPKVSGLSQPVIIYDPVTGVPYPGNVIPPSQINPVGQAYLKSFPRPTLTTGVTRNYLTQRQKRSTYNDFDGKLDTSLASTDQLFFSGSHWSDSFSDPGRIPGFQAGFGAGTSENKGYTLRLGETHMLSGNLINEFRAGHEDYHYGFLPVGFGTDQDKALGIGGPGGITTPNGISLIGGGNGFYIEYLGDFGQYVITQKMTQLSDSVTYLRGEHSFKLGGTAIRRDLSQQRTNVGKGFYFFRDAFGFQPGYSGYEVADMLVAKTNFTATGIPGYVPRDTRSWENALFVQDDWHLRPNLTLNLGLRWDVLTPYYETNNRLANYDPVTQRLVLPDQNGASRSTLNTDWNNFGPRLGFNYLWTERTAIRGGYGIFYSLDRGGIDRQLTENPPAVVTQYRFGDDAGANVKLSDPIPLPDRVNPNSPTLPQGSGIVYVPKDSQTTQVQQWSLGVQHELDSNTSGMVAYVGTRASNLAANITSAGFAGAVADRLSTTMYIGKSKYDAIQMSLRRRESNGLSYLASYTYGNARNNTPGFYGGNPSRSSGVTDASCVARGTTDCNLSLDEGPADYDVRHRFTVAATYDLPWARENRYVGGWSVNTVVTLQTGTPFTVYSDFGGVTRANQSGNPNNGPENTNEWFNTSVFKPATGSQGTASRNSVRGPGTKTIDLSLFKRFPVANAGAVELRFEGFNIFNWAQYNQPNQVVVDPQFGKITGTRTNSERQVQIAAKYIF
jgi:Carboxypeptidase regulatory-like domain/TonB-dependent Receptor Plug Domain